ncbi:MAG: M23 family metallopeptidase [Chloroflexi bacterium]|nr:M23 family metallopeptidase [Chloroflexota bacterium]
MGKSHPYTRWLILMLVVGGLLLFPSSVHAAPLGGQLEIRVPVLELRPGQAGTAFISGGYPLEISALLDGESIPVFWAGSGYQATYAFGFEAEPGEYRLAINATDPLTEESLSLEETLTVLSFQYPLESVALPFRMVPLLDADLNQAETDRLNEIYSQHSSAAYLSWPFELPVPGSVVTSRFGGFRSYNAGVLRSYHTGTDFRRFSDEPIFAAGDGIVAATEAFDVRGNVVIVDHGFGIFTHYAHLNEILVQPGQTVIKGQTVGLAGSTGRSSGPHLHFEIIVNGIPIDPIRWMAMRYNFIPPRELPPDN